MKKVHEELQKKYTRIKRILTDMRRVVVGFSGGVDSTLLLKVAKDVLSDHVLAVTANSPTTARYELTHAIRLAKLIGVEHLVVESREMDLPEFLANRADKCYHCKRSRFGDLRKLAEDRACSFVLDGENADDAIDYRPGNRATEELGVRSPLREAGLTKQEIRSLSKELNLPTWNKPSCACLATRIPYHSLITPEKLKQIDAAEECVRSLAPNAQVRVRHHGDIARIETEPRLVSTLAAHEARWAISKRFKELGFLYVALDLDGYRMGSLNRTIDTEN